MSPSVGLGHSQRLTAEARGEPRIVVRRSALAHVDLGDVARGSGPGGSDLRVFISAAGSVVGRGGAARRCELFPDRGSSRWPIVRPAAARAAGIIFLLAIVEPGAPLVLGLRRTLAFQIVDARRVRAHFRAAVWPSGGPDRALRLSHFPLDRGRPDTS